MVEDYRRASLSSLKPSYSDKILALFSRKIIPLSLCKYVFWRASQDITWLVDPTHERRLRLLEHLAKGAKAHVAYAIPIDLHKRPR